MIGTSAHGRILAVAALALAILIWLGPLSSQANRRAGPTATVAAKAPKLPCLNQSGSSYRPRVEPAACAHFGPGGSFGGGVFLENLVWSGWGAATATAAGTECGFHLPCAGIPVQVSAFRIRKRCGRRIYTRLAATSTFGTTLVKTRACLGRAY